MSSNADNPVGHEMSTGRPNQKVKKAWEQLVKEQVDSDGLLGATCALYQSGPIAEADKDKQCICGRRASQHSFTGTPKIVPEPPKKWVLKYADAPIVSVYGRLKNGARYIRCDIENDPYGTFVQMLVDDVGPELKLKLLASFYGGAEYFTMTDALEREFMSGIGQLATTEGVWILTTGLNSGVSKLIGQGIHRSTLLGDGKWKPVAIGMSKWGTIDEQTRKMLKQKNTPIFLDENQPKTMDHHHTYFFLLDDGCLTGYLDDSPRSKFVEAAREKTACYAVTIIVDGGKNTLEVIENDLAANRPVVIVHGSGRLATVLGNLLDGVDETTPISENNIKKQLMHYPALYPPPDEKKDLTAEEEQKALARQKERNNVVQRITCILDPANRKYLSVFRLDRDAKLMNAIVRAVFNCQITHENQGALLELAVEWNYLEGAHDVFKHILASPKASLGNAVQSKGNDRDYYPPLFAKALKKNWPQLVDYFLRRYYNPLDTETFIEYKRQRGSADSSSEEDTECSQFAFHFIFNVLYAESEGLSAEFMQHSICRNSPIKFKRPKKIEDLDSMYFKLIGPYAQSFYEEESIIDSVRAALPLTCCRPNRIKPAGEHSEQELRTVTVMSTNPPKTILLPTLPRNWNKPYGKQEMLRDIFLWSVCENYTDIAFVLLLQIKSRICAALVGACLAHHLSDTNKNPHIRNSYKKHREALEEYASACIDECYRQNRRRACQLLLREIPLFGNVTCMQTAIAIRSIPFINTDCFNRVLNRQWYEHLEIKSIETVEGICLFTVHIATLGFFAPRLLQYRETERGEEKLEYYNHSSNRKKQVDSPESAPGKTSNDSTKKLPRTMMGVDVNYNAAENYWYKWKQFHASPVVMIAYDFLFYIWFLLVFSYLMLFHMRSADERIHWAEIYVIITVTASLIEEFRRLGVELITRMVERWHVKDMGMLIVYAAPYVLFYIGMGLHFGSATRPDLFTASRIVLAIDLEMWYLFSLRFVSAIKLLGPKLFMIRNMMRDLVSIIYIIFICITAYGVVSRALTMYTELEFTAKSVTTAVFYQPYWFLYSIVDDEKDALDGIISSNTSSSAQVAEATVNHVLLAFHMLFINILLLSLLVAMLNFSINDVQALNKYFWRYQRYELVREYFEKPMFAFPPLSLLVYIAMLVRLIHRSGHTRYRIFKHLSTPALDSYWTDFEHASTYNYARNLVEEKYRPRSTDEPRKSVVQPVEVPPTQVEPGAQPTATAGNNEQEMQGSIIKLQHSVANMQGVVGEIQGAIGEIQAQTRELMVGMKWMMKAMKRVKMSKEDTPWENPQAAAKPPAEEN